MLAEGRRIVKDDTPLRRDLACVFGREGLTFSAVCVGGGGGAGGGGAGGILGADPMLFI